MKNLLSCTKVLTVCHLCIIVTAITSLIVMNIIQAAMYIFIRPFSPTFYRKINYYATYTLNSQPIFLAEWWSGSTCIIYSDPEIVSQFLGKEHALVLINHSCEVDWLISLIVGERVGLLANVKVCTKKMLQYIPAFGWMLKFQEMIFLERNWEKDRKTLEKQLSQLVEYPDPFWVMLIFCPEGTRFTVDKHAVSMEVARQKGLPELKHHLLPRTKGFVACVQHLKDKVPVIYDVTTVIPKRGNKPTIFNILNGKPIHCSLMLIRIPMQEIPDNEEEAALWLHKLYQRKDRLVDNFLNTGEFDPKNDMEEFKKYRNIDLPRRYYSLINMFGWASVTIFALLWYLWTSGSLLKPFLVVSFICAAYYGMMKLINLTKISKGSSYGQSGDHSTEPVHNH